MKTFLVKLTKDGSGKPFFVIRAQSENREDAIRDAVNKAKEGGIFVPDEFWTNVKEVK